MVENQSDLFVNFDEKESLTDNSQKMDIDLEFLPLGARLRPKRLEDYIGQKHIIGEDSPIYKALQRGMCYSMILWGPPGVGKTTLALLIAQYINAHFIQLSAVSSGIKDIKEAIQIAQLNQSHKRRTVLFIDEVHRFNKAQQDAFLPYIEDGTIIFIGASTENPSFELNQAILSRVRVYTLNKLSNTEICTLLDHALNDDPILKEQKLIVGDDIKMAIADLSDGDARFALNMLQMLSDLAMSREDRSISMSMLESIGNRVLKYDKGGDLFYQLISAFHKSVRGSDPNAALYWYSRIILSGGDPLYVARRLLAIATEDVGLADPNAMGIAINAYDIYKRVGDAEGLRAIAQACVYMALAPKSNSLYTAFNQAMEDAKNFPSFEVPLYLRNAPTKLMEDLGYKKGYRYAHDYPGAYAPAECFMPEQLDGREYYHPSDRGLEIKYRQKLEYLRNLDMQSKERRYPQEHKLQMREKYYKD